MQLKVGDRYIWTEEARRAVGLISEVIGVPFTITEIDTVLVEYKYDKKGDIGRLFCVNPCARRKDSFRTGLIKSLRVKTNAEILEVEK